MEHTKFYDHLFDLHQSCCRYPSPAVLGQFFEELVGVLFPEYSEREYSDKTEFIHYVDSLRERLSFILTSVPDCEARYIERQVDAFFDQLPTIRQLLVSDAEAMYAGDPAARSIAEVIRTYPGFYAMAAHRIAHQLFRQGIEVIPRAISEIAHSKTGIDIHPGAQISEYFCIDHGTGMVIGETTVIGRHVKIYQGVTLGALSVKKQDADVKRHPTIEDHVVLYAGATILGGDTVIGRGSTIGGNVWLTQSVPAESTIYYMTKMITKDVGNTDTLIHRTEK